MTRDEYEDLCVKHVPGQPEEPQDDLACESCGEAWPCDAAKALKEIGRRLPAEPHQMGAPGKCRFCGSFLKEIPGDHQSCAAGDDGRRWDVSGRCPGRAQAW